MNIILYNPLGATKGHAQEYVDNICSGLVENGVKVALVTIDSYKIEDENIRHKQRFIEISLSFQKKFKEAKKENSTWASFIIK